MVLFHLIFSNYFLFTDNVVFGNKKIRKNMKNFQIYKPYPEMTSLWLLAKLSCYLEPKCPSETTTVETIKYST